MTEPRHVPIDGRPPRLTLGLRRLVLAEWLEVDDRRDDELRAKHVLLAERHGAAVATSPEGDAGSAELLDLVLADVTARGLVELDGRLVTDVGTGITFDLDALHPVDAAARLVQEDLCVLVRGDDGRWVLQAASVCSPSRWTLAEKIGQDVRAIHAPVPRYDEQIGDAVDLSFERLTVDRPMWRVQWTLLDDPAAFQPVPPGRPREIDADRAGEQVWFRVERQTIRRLPRTDATVFTIRTYVSRLDELGPDARRDLASTLEHVDADLAAYRGWSRLLPALRGWLPATD
jgi:hypothetical protein